MSDANANRGTAASGSAFGAFVDFVFDLLVRPLVAWFSELCRVLVGVRDVRPAPSLPVPSLPALDNPPMAPPVVPGVGDTAERWVSGLVAHHGPTERCDASDCLMCWSLWPDAAD